MGAVLTFLREKKCNLMLGFQYQEVELEVAQKAPAKDRYSASFPGLKATNAFFWAFPYFFLVYEN